MGSRCWRSNSLLDNFGKVTALNIALSLLSTLILLPPLLVSADEDRGYVGITPEPDVAGQPGGQFELPPPIQLKYWSRFGSEPLECSTK